ncbi:growth hormone-inducible transmembrane protein-like [Pollicipes pollicipes]|uniref:growth hormone-inducible transmembrane protein-like n=1 Tax=Pollicipes pollicipes TaxID=41117 RepID=UPI001884ABC0|nr:growth hormone-inducible transmembrane protein-like [Pollicipes pollicipes]XP_037084252.1 growth hormone-inducible transmembrane protein-like [Pollicipes pollicipes]XP_037084253.1 growth hormone-inducible transmembrane protein-like [Pollicipes pollicipes]
MLLSRVTLLVAPPGLARSAGRLQWAPRRLLSNEGRSTFTRRATRRATLKEQAMAPAGEGAFTAGRGLVAGASVVGIGALCYYGAGLSSEMGAIDRAVMWPDYVRERVKATYLYFGSSVAVTAASAAAIFRSPAMMRLVTKNSWLAIGATFAAMIGSGMLLRSIPYEPGFGTKQLAWMLHCGVIGAVIAPLAMLGGPLLIRAAWYTAGVVGGLSAVAVCAPSDKFLYMGGPLAIGLGVVFCASVGSMFLPPTTALGAGLYSLSIYGGLVLFSMMLLYDTQRIVKKAEMHPVIAQRPFDPVNASVSIYLDTINIFMRIAMILAGGGGRRK